MNDDELLFSNTDDIEVVPESTSNKECWKILIVDDEPEIHRITKLTLVNFKFENKGLEFLHAYSANEAYAILENTTDIAITLLDVVMETDHAGLDLVKRIREEISNQSIRIVLRTGQPGEAPEKDIITNYDINDYTEKADLTAQKLFTTVVASLRSYRDILKLVESRQEILTINKKLEKEKKRIQVTLDSIGDGVMTTDASGLITHLNPVAEHLTGWSLSDAIGKDVKQVFPIVNATSGKSIENPIEKVLASGETVFLSNHTTLLSKTGEQYHIADSAAPIRHENGEIQGMVLVFNDVSEQYKLREKAAKSQRDLQMFMDHTPAVIYAKDTEGRYIFVNKQYETLFSMANNEIIGKTDYDLYSQEFADHFTSNDKIVFKSQKSVEFEESAPVGKEVHHYISNKFPLLDEDGLIYAVCGISTDITERIKQEEQLRRSQKMKAIGQLTGGIAHDFNNQLGIVIGYLDMLDDFTKEDETVHEWINMATKAAIRCSDLTRQLLSFSRTQSVEKQSTNLNDVILEYKTMLSKSITPAIKVQYFLSENLWLSDINKGEFQDALLNMVLNARDAMPNGGELLIETSNKSLELDQIIFIPNIKTGDYVQVMISDNGHGMDKDSLEKIFEPFFTTKSKGNGTGLGMAMVYGFIKRMNGFIKVYSEEKIGTTIRLYFPVSKKSSTASLPLVTPDDSQIDTGNETILIVDDEPDLLHLAKTFLMDLGYKTYVANNAEQALNMLAQHSDINLLFTDVVMPGGMNGYELAEQATNLYPDLKALLTSGFTSKAVANNGQAQFVAQLLSKPYRKRELSERIRKVLGKN